MAQQIAEDVMARLNAPAGDLLRVAVVEAENMTPDDPSASPEQRDVALAVTTVVMAMSAVFQSQPLSEAGMMLALGAVCGTVLGQCTSDPRALYGILNNQFAATLAEMSMAQIIPEGTA